MKRILILVALSLFLCSTASAFQDGGGRSTKKGSNTRTRNEVNRSATIAPPGFYVTFSRCHACGPKDAILSFRGRGIPAFYGDPKYDEAYHNIEFVERLSGVRDFSFSLLFVGPFQTEAEAQRMVYEVPSILRRQIAEDRKSGTPGGSTGFFEVGVRRVLSGIATGRIPSLPSEDLVVRPGIGVGRVLLGSSRRNVQAVLGKPRDASTDSDSWRSGDEFLIVSYKNGAVHHINVGSTKFRTATGLTMAASTQEFLLAFPKSAKVCCHSEGATGMVFDHTYWDAVNSGIALQKDGNRGALIVHLVNETVNSLIAFGFEDDERCKLCVR